MRHRIIQFEGKRFSVKLDDGVWRSLEDLAADAGLRLNQLVAQVARDADGAGVTAALRRFCLEQALARATRLEDALQARALSAGPASIALFVEACPAACLVVAQDNRILRVNAAARQWMRSEDAGLVGQSFEHLFQVRSTPPLASILEQFGRGVAAVFPARLVSVRPGRVIVASANLCPAAVTGPDDFSFLVLVDTVAAR